MYTESQIKAKVGFVKTESTPYNLGVIEILKWHVRKWKVNMFQAH